MFLNRRKEVAAGAMRERPLCIPSALARYGVAAGCVLAAFAIRFELAPMFHGRVPFSLFIPPALIAAWYGGFGPGLAALVAGVVLGQFFLLPSEFGDTALRPGDLALLLSYVATAGIGLGAITHLHRTKGRAERIRRAAGRLEQEIVERQQGEESLRESQTKLQELVDSSPMIIFAKDPEGRYLMGNRKFETVARKSAMEIIGKTDGEIFPPEQAAIYRARDQEVMETGTPLEFEEVGLQADGPHVNLVQKFPLRDRGGRVYATGGMAADITGRKREVEALRLSDERSRLLMDAGRDYTIFLLDAQGRIASWNASAQRIKGYEAREVLGQHLSRFYPPEDVSLDKVGWDLERALTKGRSEDECWWVRKDKSRFWANVIITALHDKTGELVGFSTLVRDSTERKHAEDKLRRTLALLRTTLESTGDGILVVDLAGRVVSQNRRFGVMWRIPEEVLAPKDDARLLSCVREQLVEPGSFLRKVRELMSHPEAESRDELRFKDGRVFERYSAPHRVGDEIVGRVWSFHDVTERKKTEQDLQMTKEQLARHAQDLERRVVERTGRLQETVRSLEGILYHVAHDLRAPLRTMSGFTQVLLESVGRHLGDEARDCAERIVASARRMDQLILDLLAYGRLAHSNVLCRPVALGEQIDVALGQIASLIESRNAVVEVVRPLPPVHADPVVLRQALIQLLNNALTFVAPGVRPRVRCRAEKRAASVRLWIEDNGIGIDPEHQQKIFRVFERLHRADEFSGTGIGLAIVAMGMERIGGAAGVESKRGQGSRFWLDLPANSKAA
jgi:PAS domain S-box-containing protein